MQASPTLSRRMPGRSTEVVQVFSRRRWVEYTLLVALWLGVVGYFWTWWLGQRHTGTPVLFYATSIPMFYVSTVLPSFYLFYLGWMRRPAPVTAAQAAGRLGRVAMITLTVPGSESIEIVRRQLDAMVAVRYPHDNWILVDKVHSPEIEAMARERGVRYFCRHDVQTWGQQQVDRWNRPEPPFQAKTKAGNVNAWLDAFGADYSHFTQLDIDHHPKPQYLDRTLGYFRNDQVAWVQAPSVYGNNDHWTARGSAEQELVLQGPLQMGFFGFSRTPFIIGSHCTYAMAAIRRIGGFQPTRAEDHLDTVVLASHGYEGVFVPEVIAVGDGPETFQTYLAQQFAWAYSMIQVLLTFTPRMIRKYSLRQSVQFLFVQTWYTFWSVATVVLFVIPWFSLVFDAPISEVSLWQFLLHSWPQAAAAMLIWLWSRAWHKPRTVGMSWRGIVLHIARWVVVLSAFIQVLLRLKKPYMITVKGVDDSAVRPFPLSILAPYVGLIVGCVASSWIYLDQTGHSATQGMLAFALLGAVMFCALVGVVLTQELKSIKRVGLAWGQCLRARLQPLAVAIVLAGLVGVTAAAAYDRILAAVGIVLA
jgi:cellulose synthase (UDP-forming)